MDGGLSVCAGFGGRTDVSDFEPISNRREEYLSGELTEEEAGDDPIKLFGRWFAEASEQSEGPVYAPSCMTLATADRDGTPSARIVLLKGFNDDGFVFFSDYESQKARELEDRPAAALVIHWLMMERQVRITGKVARISSEESDEYFASRPRGSQLSAWISMQDRFVTREELEEALKRLERKHEGPEIPRPSFWGGYRLDPERIEFWQGRANRLHDRILFSRDDRGGWARGRLCP
jgi:pyridoxamine 5'-phosphate oxidase